MIALAAVVAGCLIIQPGVDQVLDALPTLQPKIAAPVFLAVAVGDLVCTIVLHNPKETVEVASHGFVAIKALHELGVRVVGLAEVRNPTRGSNPWLIKEHSP